MGDEAGDFGFGNELAIDLDAFGEGDEVRRGEQPDAQAGRAIDAFEHGAGGTFAVGAGDVDEFEFVLGAAGKFGEFEGAFEARFGAELLEAVEESDGFGVGHFRRGHLTGGRRVRKIQSGGKPRALPRPRGLIYDACTLGVDRCSVALCTLRLVRTLALPMRTFAND